MPTNPVVDRIRHLTGRVADDDIGALWSHGNAGELGDLELSLGGILDDGGVRLSASEVRLMREAELAVLAERSPTNVHPPIYCFEPTEVSTEDGSLVELAMTVPEFAPGISIGRWWARLVRRRAAPVDGVVEGEELPPYQASLLASEPQLWPVTD